MGQSGLVMDTSTPDYGVEVNHGVHCLYVYCDRVVDQFVVDSAVKVILTIPSKHKPAVIRTLFTYFHMVNPHHVPQAN